MFATIVNLAFCTALATSPVEITQPPVEFVIQAPAAEEQGTLDGLLDAYCIATGLQISTDTQTRAALEGIPIVRFGALRALSGAALTQHVESLLVSNGFVLSVLPSEGNFWLSNPKLSHVAPQSHFVSAADMGYIEGHPAVMMRVAISMDKMDMRKLSTSLRPLMNHSWQEIMTIGNSQTIVLGGTGAELVSMIEMLQAVEQAELASSSLGTPQVKTAVIAPAVQVGPKLETRMLAIPNEDPRGVANTIERMAKDRFNNGLGAIEGNECMRPSFHRSAGNRKMLVRGVSAELDQIESDLALAVQLHSKEG